MVESETVLICDGVIAQGEQVRRGAGRDVRHDCDDSAYLRVLTRGVKKRSNLFGVKGLTAKAVDVNRDWFVAFRAEAEDVWSYPEYLLLVNPAENVNRLL